MRVFVTGATGFIGRALVDALLRRGWQVTALVRNLASQEAARLAERGVALVKGDVTDPASMREPMRGVDVVIHSAGWYEYGIGGKEAEASMQATHVNGTRNVLELAAELGVPRTVYVSTTVALGDTGGAVCDETFKRAIPPATVYERTKTDAHEVALELIAGGAPVMIGMPALVFGPGNHANHGILARMYVRGMAPPTTVGKGKTSWVYVDDCAECLALIAERGRIGESYIISSDSMDYRELGTLFAATPGGMKPRLLVSGRMMLPTARLSEAAQRLFGLPNLLSVEAMRTADLTYTYSGAKAQRELSWQPGDVRAQWNATLAEERRRAGKG